MKRKFYEYSVRKTSSLVPYANNSRTHSDEQIKEICDSMLEVGFTNPILIDEDGGIIAGHGRLLAASKLGFDEVPCIILSGLTEAQRRAYIIGDNKIALNAGWSEAMLVTEFEYLKAVGYDLSKTGFDPDELSEIINRVALAAKPVPTVDPDAAPPVQAHATTKPGDIWLCGDHRVMCGDSTSIDAVDLLMAGSLADMLLTDPPYNVAYVGKTKDALTIENDSMSNAAFRLFLSDAFTAASTAMKGGAVFYIWHADSEGYNFRGACIDAGWQVRQCLIWNKNSMVMGRQDYHWKHEPCLYGWKDGAGHLWAADRKQTTILEFDRPSRSEDHPTMKPIALFEYQMLNNTKGMDIVLDLFGGSGTTMIAAEKNGRKGYLMELDPRYCDVIVKRWQEYTGKGATLESSGETFNSLKDDV